MFDVHSQTYSTLPDTLLLLLILLLQDENVPDGP